MKAKWTSIPVGAFGRAHELRTGFMAPKRQDKKERNRAAMYTGPLHSDLDLEAGNARAGLPMSLDGVTQPEGTEGVSEISTNAPKVQSMFTYQINVLFLQGWLTNVLKPLGSPLFTNLFELSR